MTTIAYDRRSIMQEAWEMTTGTYSARMFARNLRQAWWNAKRRIQLALQSGADRTRAAIDELENKDNWSQEDYARISVLRAALRAKVEHEQADPYAAKRDLIQNATACTVTFQKADGTRRVMRVEAREVRKHVKGERASPAGRKAAHTRAFRHPNLLPIWDSEAKAIKSVNLSTVSTIETADATHTF